MKSVGFIPARYQSSRFPGKPLADICGKPMLWWVYGQAKKSSLLDEVIVATDDQRIQKKCADLGLNCIMTSDSHKTGTDRICEAAKSIQADIIVNIQGDEPLIDPMNIDKAIMPLLNNKDISVTNLMAKIQDPVEALNCTIPKVIANSEGRGIFLTRSPAPYPKGSIDYSFYKQVCVYAFRPQALEFYERTPRGKIECIEDIEILRFIENAWHVQFIEVVADSIAVDTVYDLEKVQNIIAQRYEGLCP